MAPIRDGYRGSPANDVGVGKIPQPISSHRARAEPAAVIRADGFGEAQVLQIPADFPPLTLLRAVPERVRGHKPQHFRVTAHLHVAAQVPLRPQLQEAIQVAVGRSAAIPEMHRRCIRRERRRKSRPSIVHHLGHRVRAGIRAVDDVQLRSRLQAVMHEPPRERLHPGRAGRGDQVSAAHRHSTGRPTAIDQRHRRGSWGEATAWTQQVYQLEAAIFEARDVGEAAADDQLQDTAAIAIIERRCAMLQRPTLLHDGNRRHP